MPFQAPKHYRTRSGKVARVYATDGAAPDCIHGAFYEDADEGGWHSATWDASGAFHHDGKRCCLDLIDPAASIPEPEAENAAENA